MKIKMLTAKSRITDKYIQMTQPDGAKTMETDSINNFFTDLKYILELSDKNKKETDLYLASDFSVFDYIHDDENIISDIISHMLDPKGKHGQGSLFLEKFVQLIIDSLESSNYRYNTKNSGINNLKKADSDIKKAKVNREVPTSDISRSMRRMDILIKIHKFGLMIENKPWAKDQDDQLSNYYDHLKKEFKENFIIIYLSGDGLQPSKNSINKEDLLNLKKTGNYCQINYPTEFKSWLEQCIRDTQAEKIRSFIRDFISYIEKMFQLSINYGGKND